MMYNSKKTYVLLGWAILPLFCSAANYKLHPAKNMPAKSMQAVSEKSSSVNQQKSRKPDVVKADSKVQQRSIPKEQAKTVAAAAAVARQFNNVWSISKELYTYIVSILPEGSTILEFGSGWGTSELAKKYTMFSVENDSAWLNKYDTTYIYAPIVHGWYDVEVLKKELPSSYDLILIDGPLAKIGRGKFFDNIHLFNTNVPMIFDDVNRQPELDLLNKVATYLNRPTTIISGNGKKFGVILP